MFTGIIEALGTVARIDRGRSSARLSINTGSLDLGDVIIGDSVAVSGPCLTVVATEECEITVDVSRETLARTTLGTMRAGDPVNLEKALRLSDRLGGHIVSGHIDGVGTAIAREVIDNYVQYRFAAPMELAKYIAAKGAICVDGISLTVNDVDGCEFELMVIPHTLKGTTLGSLDPGHSVNLEIDLLARYLERLANFAEPRDTEPLTVDALRRAGFVAS